MAFARGTGLTLEQATAYALGFTAERRAAPAETDRTPTPLTRREQQVAGLVAEGLSNKDIADRLVISQRTAEGHVERILTKLRFQLTNPDRHMGHRTTANLIPPPRRLEVLLPSVVWEGAVRSTNGNSVPHGAFSIWTT